MGATGSWLRHLRPTPGEVRELALREVDPRRYREFEPIARGPLFAALALLAIGVAALPACALRLLRGWSGSQR